MVIFKRLLWNALLSGVMGYFLWFALTFWVYLETHSVIATSVIGGAFAVFSAVFGMFFGTFVDHHRKHTAMVRRLGQSRWLLYGLAIVQYSLVVDRASAATCTAFTSGSSWRSSSPARSSATCARSPCRPRVTLLVPEETTVIGRTGMVGTVMGVSFTITSVLSGLVVGRLGMGWALRDRRGVTALAVLHLLTIRVDEPEPAAIGRRRARQPTFDVSGRDRRRSDACPACSA